jgi:hypothetical protein
VLIWLFRAAACAGERRRDVSDAEATRGVVVADNTQYEVDRAAFIRAKVDLALSRAPVEARAKLLDLLDLAFSNEANEIDRSLAESLLNNETEVSLGADGELRYRLTQSGLDRAIELIHDRPDLRAFYGRLRGEPLVDPPKGKQ